jgi:hypothetical protein
LVLLKDGDKEEEGGVVEKVEEGRRLVGLRLASVNSDAALRCRQVNGAVRANV